MVWDTVTLLVDGKTQTGCEFVGAVQCIQYSFIIGISVIRIMILMVLMRYYQVFDIVVNILHR